MKNIVVLIIIIISSSAVACKNKAVLAKVEIFDDAGKIMLADAKARVVDGPEEHKIYVMLSVPNKLERLTKENKTKRIRIVIDDTHVNRMIIANPISSGMLVLDIGENRDNEQNPPIVSEEEAIEKLLEPFGNKIPPPTNNPNAPDGGE